MAMCGSEDGQTEAQGRCWPRRRSPTLSLDENIDPLQMAPGGPTFTSEVKVRLSFGGGGGTALRLLGSPKHTKWAVP